MKLFICALFCLKFLCAAATEAVHHREKVFAFPGQGTFLIHLSMVDGVLTAVISDAGALNGVHPKYAVESGELPILRPKPGIEKSAAELRELLGAQLRCSSPERRTPLNPLGGNTPPRKAKKCLAEDDEGDGQSKSTPPDPRRGRECSPETIIQASAQKQKTTINFKKKIEEAFDGFNVERILCFFSHCDKDHWNLHDFLPALPTIYVMGLGWSNDKLNSLKKPHSYVFKINEEVINTGFGEYILSKKYRHVGLNLFGLSDSYISALNFVRLWGVNLCPTRGSNENSMLLSITSAQLNKTFFMTGDATQETFAALEEKKINPAALIKSAYPDALNHLVFAVVPHHGSSATFPHKFLTMVDPDAFIFTAGRGAAYGHPRMDIVTHLLERENRRVWRRFNMVNPVSFLGFQPTGGKGPDVRYQPMNVTLTMDNPLILGTNVSQRLRFSAEGVFQEFNPFLSINNEKYTWDYCNHVYETDLETITCVPKMHAPVISERKYNIGYDEDEIPIAYFIQVGPKLWYGYRIEETT